MSSTGSPNPPEDPHDTESPVSEPETGDFPLALLLIAIAALIVAVVGGIPIMRAVYGLISPPPPPAPPSLTELRYTRGDADIEEWLYSTRTDACTLITFYREAGGVCEVAAGYCDAPGEPNPSLSEIATCRGTQRFSDFAQRWRAVIATGYADDAPVRLRLARQLVWSDNPPESTLP